VLRKKTLGPNHYAQSKKKKARDFFRDFSVALFSFPSLLFFKKDIKKYIVAELFIPSLFLRQRIEGLGLIVKIGSTSQKLEIPGDLE
jgi:hypothetical protein